MLKVVHVQWQDPCHAESGWMPKEDFIRWIKEGATPVDTVGILAYEAKDFIVIIQSIGNRVVADGIKITRSAITNIEVLSKVPLTLELGSI